MIRHTFFRFELSTSKVLNMGLQGHLGGSIILHVDCTMSTAWTETFFIVLHYASTLSGMQSVTLYIATVRGLLCYICEANMIIQNTYIVYHHQLFICTYCFH